jgi:nitroreductase
MNANPSPAGDSRACQACTSSREVSDDALLIKAAESGMLAPSAYNSQPWTFRLVRGALELHADVSRARTIADPDEREMFLACGAALENVRIALRHMGREVDLTILPDRARPHFVARIRLGEHRHQTASEARYFAAIPRRRSSRSRLYPRPIPYGIAPALEHAVESAGAFLSYVHGTVAREALAHTIREADHAQARNARFRRELASWLRVNDTNLPDGIPGFAFGLSTPLAALAPHVLRTIPSEQMRAVRDDELALGAPLLGVVLTARDEPHDWVLAGQGIERALLSATSHGLSTGFMNQAIQLSRTRERMRRLLNTDRYPVAILRFGFGSEVRRTPRRALKDVLVRAT